MGESDLAGVLYHQCLAKNTFSKMSKMPFLSLSLFLCSLKIRIYDNIFMVEFIRPCQNDTQSRLFSDRFISTCERKPRLPVLISRHISYLLLFVLRYKISFAFLNTDICSSSRYHTLVYKYLVLKVGKESDGPEWN